MNIIAGICALNTWVVRRAEKDQGFTADALQWRSRVTHDAVADITFNYKGDIVGDIVCVCIYIYIWYPPQNLCRLQFYWYLQ